MQRYKLLVVGFFAVLMLIGTVGIHLLNHQCHSLHNHRLIITVHSLQPKGSCQICHPEQQKEKCCSNHQNDNEAATNCCSNHQNDNETSTNCCKTEDLYFKINSEYTVSFLYQNFQPNEFELPGFPESNFQIASLFTNKTIVNENQPPIPLWGTAMLQVYCSFKIGHC